MFLSSSRLTPSAEDSFLLENPLGSPPEAVRLRMSERALEVIVPEGLQGKIDSAVTESVRGLSL